MAATVGIGGVAAFVSYGHALQVIRDHGERGASAFASPLCIDGLLLVASLTMLDSARRGQRPPGLARWALASGIAATIALNAMHGLARGPVSAVLAAWPALCLIITVEMVMGMIRRGRATVGVTPMVEPVEVTEPGNLSHVRWVSPEPVPAEVGDEAEVPEVLPADETPVLVPAEVLASARDHFADVLATGDVPSVRAIRSGLRVGHPRAVRIRAALTEN